MQQVSQEWKDAQQQTIVPECFIEVSMSVGISNIGDMGTASDNGHEAYANTAQTIDETDKEPLRYATLEKNIWALDGSFLIVPDEAPYGNNGYIGNLLSNENGNFSVTPTLTITMPDAVQDLAPGITVTWGTAYGEYAESFRVSAYQGVTATVPIYQQTVENNSGISSVVIGDLQYYNKITIEVLKWNKPYRRARIESVFVGIRKTYTKSELISFSHRLFADPLSAELPKAEIRFELANLNGEFNPDNPQGAERYLMERQEIKAKYGFRIGDAIEWIKCGTFYLSEWDTPQNGITASFAARDLLEYMNGLFVDPTASSQRFLSDVANAALSQANLPLNSDGTNRWTLHSSLGSILAADNMDLSNYTIAEVLQLAANAACCVFYQDRNGILHIDKLASASSTDYIIDKDNCYSWPEINLSKQLKEVNVNDGGAIVSVGTAGETQKVDNIMITPIPIFLQEKAVANWTAAYLKNRRVLSGEWRADPRLDVLDRVTVENQFSESTVLITEIEYAYNGSFHGSFSGRAGV